MWGRVCAGGGTGGRTRGGRYDVVPEAWTVREKTLEGGGWSEYRDINRNMFTVVFLSEATRGVNFWRGGRWSEKRFGRGGFLAESKGCSETTRKNNPVTSYFKGFPLYQSTRRVVGSGALVPFPW